MTTVTSTEFVDVAVVEEALSARQTLPTSWYWDPRALDFELRGIFGRTWHVAGPLEKLERRGDHIVTQAGNVPIVVLRDDRGELRAFVNVCRHRGYRVAQEDGSRAFLQCLYHGWTYNLDGTLRRTPGCAAGEFDGAGLALLPVSVDVWNRFVFVNPDATAGRLLDAFPELDVVASDIQFDPAGYTYEGKTDVDIAGNWKGWCENSVECYHCPTIHKDSFDAHLASAPISQGEGVSEGTTENLIHACAALRDQFRSPEQTASHAAGGPTPGLRFVYLFPGTFLIQDEYMCFAGYTVPLAPDKTVFSAHAYVREGADPAARQDWELMWDQTFAEDAEAVRLQQGGYASDRLAHGQLSQQADRMILKFHELVWRHYRAALPS